MTVRSSVTRVTDNATGRIVAVAELADTDIVTGDTNVVSVGTAVASSSVRDVSISFADANRSLRFLAIALSTISALADGRSARSVRGSGVGFEQCENITCNGFASSNGAYPASSV